MKQFKTQQTNNHATKNLSAAFFVSFFELAQKPAKNFHRTYELDF